MAGLKDIVRFSRIPANGINLHVAEAGPPDGPLVFLLHGFPEFWYGWRNQIAPLAKRGFHVVAPDQRGYNLSDKPTGAGNYNLDHLASDVVGLADRFRQETFAVVGHDWGASVGWWLAGQHARRVRSLAALNAPHPAVWIHAMREHPVQKRKSRYVRFFQIPRLPEWLVGLNHSKALAKGFQDCIRPGAFTTEDLEQYRSAWAQPGALTAMINYYRAILQKPPLPVAEYRITCPTLVIWGKRDAYALPDLAEASIRLCAGGRIAWLDQASHWVQHDEPQHVTELLAEFLR
jgi:pimeloyl-ACP methyl ester carboxylesterase